MPKYIEEATEELELLQGRITQLRQHLLAVSRDPCVNNTSHTGNSPSSPPATPPPRPSEEFASLTQREAEILTLLSQGLTNRKIARRLSIAELTVKSHMRVIFLKLDVEDRTQAALKAALASKPRLNGDALNLDGDAPKRFR
ncbi:helix-turn-helix domain-containing protein [Streptomyces daliensis]